MAEKIAVSKEMLVLEKWSVVMSEELGGVVLLMFPAQGEPIPIIMRPAQAVTLGHDLQTFPEILKPTVQ
ncbi:hypothetical protein P9273_03495 [Mesorhizobium sp. WSM4935]|uniref:hypothetical protein n=1 Tax=Mesorhizobium sp. WSM4935 TaxID=3038547 RepID=UPI002414EC95|nr:hypothetical protein [Mesorhizobium sp. WSM4935]MDG4874162.1 hypothetical protein [Mesorhizobium sp. WSM4935]